MAKQAGIFQTRGSIGNVTLPRGSRISALQLCSSLFFANMRPRWGRPVFRNIERRRSPSPSFTSSN